MLRQKTERSIDPKSELCVSSAKHPELTERMRETVEDYILSLHGVSETSKVSYLSILKTFRRFLMKRDIKRFEDVTSRDIDLFLSNYPNDNTKNAYSFRLKHFYSMFLKMPHLVKHLELVNNELPPVTPSELLTPDEVVKLANNASQRREFYKVIILVLFESCARISEVLSLHKGDVVFSSVVDKEGKRKLIATLYFKRSKGKVNKQPIVLTMFASELKRWVDNHPGESQAWLFPSL